MRLWDLVEAAIMAQNNSTAAEIVSAIEKLKPNVRASFVVDTLTYLYRGGCCNAVAAMADGVVSSHCGLGTLGVLYIAL